MRWVLLLVSLLALHGASARAETLNIEAAKNHFGAGKAYYDERRWEDALREFKEAYRLSKKPALLYNIALCNERLLRYEEAVEVLRNYLRIDPNAEDKAGIERKVADLDTAIKNTRPGEPPPPLPTHEPNASAGPSEPITLPPEVGLSPKPATSDAATRAGTPARRRRVATWAVGGVGLALLAAGAGTAVASHLDYQSLLDQCGPSRNDCPAGYEATRDRGQRLSWASTGLLAAGGVAVVAATILYFFEGRPRAEPKGLTLLPLIPPGGGAGLAGSIEF